MRKKQVPRTQKGSEGTIKAYGKGKAEISMKKWEVAGGTFSLSLDYCMGGTDATCRHRATTDHRRDLYGETH